MSTTPENEASPPPGFDPDAMRERYRIERDKRLRPDGIEQYIEVTGQFAKYLDDPYVERIDRDPIEAEHEVALIGGGFGGLQAGARLREAGVEDICLIEKGGDFGGTWYWNRYPGAQCDVESYIYLPLLEEIGYIPKEKYSYAREILDYSRKIGKHYNLYEGALFQTEVTELRWDDSVSRWIVSTNRGDKIRARFVAMANGPLNRPKLPGIPGIRDYKGHTFHTSRWDYEYTGSELDKLSDKRVAIIGTGATAIQCVPFVGETAKHLYVFQRTPSSVDVRGNRPTDPEWAKSLHDGWQRERMENFNSLVLGVPQQEDLVNDGWTDLIGKMMARFRAGGSNVAEMMEMANFEKMNEIRARVDDLVEDPDAAEKLKPYYPMFCKRPTANDEYLPTFNRPNVTLVDTDGKGVDRITERGLLVGDNEYQVDCIIFATGFEVGTDYTRRAGYDVVGRGNQKLSEKWERGMATLHGMQSHGYPNCFFMSWGQGAFTANYPHLLDEIATHISHIIKHAREKGYQTIEVTKEAEEAWVQTIIKPGGGANGAGAGAVIAGKDCTPSYRNNEGRPSRTARQAAPYAAGSIAFFKLLGDWRETGMFEGLEFGP